uniref:Kinesin motor domain-containing protein n=1 Tax=Trichobilharzia regenti TaxID=157069 RepID=A0AA85JDG5_TRIRE|nr:unnamed protein product [Trichobilharzia regenti]
MNIDAICKISSTGYASTIRSSENQTLCSNIDGVTCRFREIVPSETKNIQIFEKHIKSLVKAFLSGYNACILCYGEVNSRINMLINGPNSHQEGILKLIMLEIFRNVFHDELNLNLHKEALSVQSLLIGSEGFTDLIRRSESSSSQLKTTFTVNNGYQVEGLQEVHIDSFNTAVNICTQAAQSYFGRICKTDQELDDIPASFIFRIKLNGEKLNDGITFRSKLSLVCITGFEWLSRSMKNGADLESAELLELYNLTFQLASGKPGNRKFPNYSASRLTKLLYDEIGGNCYTRIILCLSSTPDPETYTLLLRLTSQFTHITNAPVMNDDCALLLAARAREAQYLLEQVILEQDDKTNINSIYNGNKIRNTDPPFLRLKEHVQELSESLEKTHLELAHATDERVKLSKAWLVSEEDRMQANEKLAQTELQLHEVRLKNDELRMLCEKGTEALKHVTELQKSNEMLNRYCTKLKRKLEDLHKELDKMSMRNEELSRELLHQTVEQKSVLTFLANKTSNRMKELPRFEKELNRVEMMLGVKSHKNGSENFNPSPETFEHKANTNPNSINNPLQKKKYTDPSDNILKKAEEQVKLDMVVKERDYLQSEITKTNQKLTHILDKFRTRLIYHISGITRLVDAAKSNDQIIAREAVYGLEKYTNHLLADVQATYKIRENELIKMIQSLNTQFQATREAIHKVMIFYAKLRTQAIQRDSGVRDPGPTPQDLIDQLNLPPENNTDYLLNLSASVMAESTEPVRNQSKLLRRQSLYD